MDFLAKFSKEATDVFKHRSSQENPSRLIKLENSNLFVSPSKLFKGKEVPRVSDSKQSTKKFFEIDKDNHTKSGSSVFFNSTKNQAAKASSGKGAIEDISDDTNTDAALLGKRPFSPSATTNLEDNVVKKLRTSEFFLKSSPVPIKEKFDQDKKQGKERLPSRKASPSKMKSLKKWNKVKQEEIENNSSLLSTLNTNLDYRVKFEGGELPKIRKKVCRKLYEIFCSKYKLGKREAKHVALNLEYRMDTTFNHEVDSKMYRKNFKVLLKHLDVSLNLADPCFRAAIIGVMS